MSAYRKALIAFTFSLLILGQLATPRPVSAAPCQNGPFFIGVRTSPAAPIQEGLNQMGLALFKTQSSTPGQPPVIPPGKYRLRGGSLQTTYYYPGPNGTEPSGGVLNFTLKNFTDRAMPTNDLTRGNHELVLDLYDSSRNEFREICSPVAYKVGYEWNECAMEFFPPNPYKNQPIKIVVHKNPMGNYDVARKGPGWDRGETVKDANGNSIQMRVDQFGVGMVEIPPQPPGDWNFSIGEALSLSSCGRGIQVRFQDGVGHDYTPSLSANTTSIFAGDQVELNWINVHNLTQNGIISLFRADETSNSLANQIGVGFNVFGLCNPSPPYGYSGSCIMDTRQDLDPGLYNFRIFATGEDSSFVTKTVNIEVKKRPSNAPTPTLMPTRIPIPTIGVFKCDKNGQNCTRSGGEPCDTGQGPGISTAIGCVPTQPVPLIKGLVRFSSMMGGGIALLLMAWGAIQMITSAGNPENLKKGHDQFINAAVGLLIIILAVTLMEIIGVDILQIPGFSKSP